LFDGKNLLKLCRESQNVGEPTRGEHPLLIIIIAAPPPPNERGEDRKSEEEEEPEEPPQRPIFAVPSSPVSKTHFADPSPSEQEESSTSPPPPSRSDSPPPPPPKSGLVTEEAAELLELPIMWNACCKLPVLPKL
jgi:hypothetical protein